MPPNASLAIPPQPQHLPLLMFLQARGTAGLLLCYFKGWLPWEAKCPKQVGQEAGAGLQGVDRCLLGCTNPQQDAQLSGWMHGGTHGPSAGCTAPQGDVWRCEGMRGPVKGCAVPLGRALAWESCSRNRALGRMPKPRFSSWKSVCTKKPPPFQRSCRNPNHKSAQPGQHNPDS